MTSPSPAESPRTPKERPILFSGPMVKAILEGRKTQTRRIAKFVSLKPGVNLGFSGVSAGHYNTGNPASGHVLYSRGRGGVWQQITTPLHCPHGQPGDRLWVREAFLHEWPDMDRPEDEDEYRRWVIPHYAATGPKPDLVDPNTERPPGWRPSIHMPRWASRITLELTQVRVQRLQDISEEDAKAEGIQRTTSVGPCRAMGWRGFDGAPDRMRAVAAFEDLWDSINGEGAWEANSWVWALTFRRVEG